MKTLDQDLKNQTFRPCYLLYGTEAYLKRVYKRKFIQTIAGDDTMNFQYFSQQDIQVPELISICDTLPFFADYRLVVVEKSGFFKSSQEEFAQYLEQMPETTILLFVEDEVDKRNKIYKRFAKQGYVCEMSTQSQGALEKWIGQYVMREGRQISIQTIRLLLTMAGEDMTTLASELEKLLSYTMGREMITPEDVQAVCIKRSEVRIFDMFDAIAAGDRKKTFGIYYELVENKEPLMRILYMLSRQFNQLAMVKSMTEDHMSAGEITKAMGLRSDWVTKQLQKQSSHYKLPQLLRALEECVSNEEQVKTGNLDERAAVEMILARYS